MARFTASFMTPSSFFFTTLQQLCVLLQCIVPVYAVSVLHNAHTLKYLWGQLSYFYSQSKVPWHIQDCACTPKAKWQGYPMQILKKVQYFASENVCYIFLVCRAEACLTRPTCSFLQISRLDLGAWQFEFLRPAHPWYHGSQDCHRLRWCSSHSRPEELHTRQAQHREDRWVC